MRFARILIPVAFITTIAANSHAETIKVGGSGGMIPLVTPLAKAFMKKEPGTTVDVNQKSMGKEGGLLALTKQAIDIAMVASIEPRMKALPLVMTEIALVPGVFAVNQGVKVKGLTSQQICDIYAGRITNWKQVGGADAPVVVLTRPEHESTKVAVRQGIACFSSLKESPSAIMIEKSPEMYAAIPKTPNSIGMVTSVAVDDAKGAMVPLRLDGLDVEKSGTKWPIMHRFNLATGKSPKDAAMRFIRFIRSPEGEKVIRQERAYPVR